MAAGNATVKKVWTLKEEGDLNFHNSNCILRVIFGTDEGEEMCSDHMTVRQKHTGHKSKVKPPNTELTDGKPTTLAPS